MLETAPTIKRRILIADHNPLVVAQIARGIDDHGAYDIHTATTAATVRDELQHTTFDLLIIDQAMTHLDELTQLRQTQTHARDALTIVMMTVSTHEVTSLPDSLYAHHYLAKPFAADELFSIIDSIFAPAPINPPPDPIVLKVILGGDANVGKSSLVQRYCTRQFDPNRQMTIGVDFHVSDVQVQDTPVRLVIWDLGGQERFAFARLAFYRGTQAVGLVYDATNRTSFFNLMRWWRETRENLPDVPVLLLANKTDLPRAITCDESLAIAQAWDMPFFESSCATGEGVTEFFDALALAAWKHKQTHRNKKRATG